MRENLLAWFAVLVILAVAVGAVWEWHEQRKWERQRKDDEAVAANEAALDAVTEATEALKEARDLIERGDHG